MTNKTKHRILGLLVIAGLIVIAVPLFHSNKSDLMDNPLKEVPPFPSQTVQDQSMLQATELDQIAVSENLSSVTATPGEGEIGKLSMNDAAAGQLVLPMSGWVVQLGSFKNKINALRLVNQLRAEGYHAFFNSNHDALTRVFIGPEKNKTDASMLADQVNKSTHLHGIIINYKSLTL